MKNFSVRLVLVLLALVFSCQGVAMAAEDGKDQPKSWADSDDVFDDALPEAEVWDPIEPVNRGIFWLNDKLYFYLFKPVARGYGYVVPAPARKAVDNVFDNIYSPVSIINSFLQGKIDNGLDTFTKFFVNTIFGFGGLIDHFEDIEEQPTVEDFGQTLGHYGVKPGFYLVLPVIGPRNLRDGVGFFADRYADPITSPYYLKLKDYEAWGLRAYDRINWLSLDKDTYEAIKRDALDPYLFVRGAYMQRRAAEVAK